MSKSLQQGRTELVENFLKLTASHWVRESELEGKAELTISDDILLRTDSELDPKVADQVRQGIVVEDELILRSDRSGAVLDLPVKHLKVEPGVRNLALTAIFHAGSKIPLVGRLRAKFDDQGQVASMSLTDSSNRTLAPVRIVTQELGGGAIAARRVMTVYVDGFYWGTLIEVEPGIWERPPVTGLF